jgi:hypothetical protein
MGLRSVRYKRDLKLPLPHTARRSERVSRQRIRATNYFMENPEVLPDPPLEPTLPGEPPVVDEPEPPDPAEPDPPEPPTPRPPVPPLPPDPDR